MPRSLVEALHHRMESLYKTFIVSHSNLENFCFKKMLEMPLNNDPSEHEVMCIECLFHQNCQHKFQKIKSPDSLCDLDCTCTTS